MIDANRCTPAAMRASVAGARGRFRPKIEGHGSDQSMMVDAGTHCARMTRGRTACAHRTTTHARPRTFFDTGADIGSRMLAPHELFAAQGFPSTYRLVGTKTQQTALAGNSVCPALARALVAANYQPMWRELAA